MKNLLIQTACKKLRDENARLEKMPHAGAAVRDQERGMVGDPVLAMVNALHVYQSNHWKEFESDLADDYFLGKEWLAALKSVRALLNGTGSFDGGVCDAVLLDALTSAGFDEECL